MKILLLFSALLGILLLTTEVAFAEDAKRIAFSFDDAPRSAGAYTDVQSRTDALINALEEAGIDGAIFFATTRNLEKRGAEGDARLRRYAAAGHLIGNHSDTHQSANVLSAKAFLMDVAQAGETLEVYPGYTPYFRFPFLHEGDTVEKRDAIRDGLDAQALQQGYVTVDNYDWYLQALFDESIRSGREPDLKAWKTIYVEVLSAAIVHYDQMALEFLGRSPAHVMLLHENDLAALFVDDLARALTDDGWELVTALEAYKDPIASDVPDTLVLGQGRIAALAHIAGKPGRELAHPWESEDALRALLVERGMLDGAATVSN